MNVSRSSPFVAVAWLVSMLGCVAESAPADLSQDQASETIRACTPGRRGVGGDSSSQCPRPDAGGVPAPEPQPETPARRAPANGFEGAGIRIDRARLTRIALTELERQGYVGAGIGIVHQGQVVYQEDFGWAVRDRERFDYFRTMVQWGSISKSLTAVTALSLGADGVLGLDDDVSQHIAGYRVPDSYAARCADGADARVLGVNSYPCSDGWATIPLSDPQKKMTLRQLAGHIAGVRHYDNAPGLGAPPDSFVNSPRSNTGMEWALRYFVHDPLVAPPRTRYSYSTFGYNLLGVALEHAAGRTLSELVTDRIARPSGMRTLRADVGWESIADRAVGYRRTDEGEVRVTGSDDARWKLAGGGFLSSTEDLTKFCQALSGNELLSEADKRVAFTSMRTQGTAATGYGFGFELGTRYGRSHVGHSGDAQKAQTRMRLYPNEGLCIVVMTNATWVSTAQLVDVIEDGVRELAR